MSGIVADNVDRASGVVTAAAAGPTISASDPTISTNATLGTQWANSTSGEFYVCTDATADANVWTNVGGGSGDIEPWAFQGESYGYASGGASNVIDKWTLASDANATDVGDLSVNRYGTCGTSGQTHGFNAGNGGYTDVIDKFSFTSDGNSTDVGNITVARDDSTGQSSSTHGYCSGGSNASGYSNIVDKWSHSSDGNATDVGDLTTSVFTSAGQSSANHGYTSGGGTGINSNVID